MDNNNSTLTFDGTTLTASFVTTEGSWDLSLSSVTVSNSCTTHSHNYDYISTTNVESLYYSNRNRKGVYVGSILNEYYEKEELKKEKYYIGL